MKTDFSFEKFNILIRQDNVAKCDTYLNAPLYYALTGRQGIWIYQGYGALMVVCCHPHQPDRLLAFPEIGGAEGKLAASVLSDLSVPAGGVQLARFNEQELESLRRALAEKNHTPVSHITVMEEPDLDWRFPVHILDTAKVSLLQGRDFMKIRNKIRKVQDNTTMLPLNDPDALRGMRAAHKYWEGSMMMRDIEGGDTSGFYEALFRMIDEWPELFNGVVFIQDKRPVGFTIYDRPFMRTANLLANLGDASIGGLADFQIVETCRAMDKQGITHMNFGGSEVETLDLFKRKFMPAKSLDIISAEIVYTDHQDGQVKALPLGGIG